MRTAHEDQPVGAITRTVSSAVRWPGPSASSGQPATASGHTAPTKRASSTSSSATSVPMHLPHDSARLDRDVDLAAVEAAWRPGRAGRPTPDGSGTSRPAGRRRRPGRRSAEAGATAIAPWRTASAAATSRSAMGRNQCGPGAGRARCRSGGTGRRPRSTLDRVDVRPRRRAGRPPRRAPRSGPRPASGPLDGTVPSASRTIDRRQPGRRASSRSAGVVGGHDERGAGAIRRRR